ncbi:glycoside hydrolase family 13 protein [Sporolactobacillus laevolacticus]|uniref:glycoside hydrolase family 13 protein n=1 Tax=Sporolactobacillus laevolacticus TaxID=33018 RepID=UPI0025B41218|nr:glycoside hydrolase family 13 protein [Sporolactobacillus laevolacticus]MDN3954228.1 glycoside hydrolase family 13 protein [Sporolactobacillus laevolacticus]
MEKSAVYHQPCSAYAYPYDNDTIHLKIRTKKNDTALVTLIWGDPFENIEVENDNYQWVSKQSEMQKIAQTDLHDYWFISIKPPFHRLQYGFVLTGTDGKKEFYGDRGFLVLKEETFTTPDNFFKFPFIHEVDRFKAPEWVKSTVWYQIFPERFANGDPSISPKNALPWGSKDPGRDDFFGGDLKGIIDHLDYLQDLGINGIYLNPIFEAPTNHKYDTLDYFEIDPHFGDKETFRKLVQEAHNRGIRIMLDAVFNHIGSTSKQWLDVVKNEEKSPYKDWFHIRSFPVREDENGNFEGKTTLSFDTFAFTPKMPKLNTANPEVQQYLLDIATYWIREFDIDGWRLDVANEVDHAFWKTFHEAVINEKSDVYIVGEIWHDAWNWLQGDEFHSVMNYPLTQSILNFFVEDKITATEAVSAINEHFMKYTQSANEVTFNLLDSHDTARILTKANGDKQKVKQALAFLFAQAGSPCVYYGTEIGMDGDNDPLCRKCMIWDNKAQDQDLFAFVKQLIHLRKRYQPILSYGIVKWLILDNEKKLLCFRKEHNGHALIFVFNHGDADEKVVLSDYRLSLDNVWTGEEIESGCVLVPAQDFLVLKTEI